MRRKLTDAFFLFIPLVVLFSTHTACSEDYSLGVDEEKQYSSPSSCSDGASTEPETELTKKAENILLAEEADGIFKHKARDRGGLIVQLTNLMKAVKQGGLESALEDKKFLKHHYKRLIGAVLIDASLANKADMLENILNKEEVLFFDKEGTKDLLIFLANSNLNLQGYVFRWIQYPEQSEQLKEELEGEVLLDSGIATQIEKEKSDYFKRQKEEREKEDAVQYVTEPQFSIMQEPDEQESLTEHEDNSDDHYYNLSFDDEDSEDEEFVLE